jgi:integrase
MPPGVTTPRVIRSPHQGHHNGDRLAWPGEPEGPGQAPAPGVYLVPVTDDAPALWDTWGGMGGKGIVLKERTSVYRPGLRSPAWLKLKPKVTLEVVVTGGSADRVRWGDWGDMLRHTFASMLIEAGEPLTYVQQQLGHHSAAFTVKVYGHLLPRGDRRAVNALDDATIRNPAATEVPAHQS